MKTKLVLFQGNDQTIQLTGVTDAAGDPISDATIVGTLLDRTGTATVGFQDAPFTPDVNPGNYDLAVPADLVTPVLTPVGSYNLEVDGTTSSGNFIVFVPTEVQKRDP